MNFKDYLNLKDYLTSIILKIISPQANSYKFQKVLRPQQLVGHRSWNMKFWNSLSGFSCFWRATFSYEPIQPNKIFHLPRVLELFGSPPLSQRQTSNGMAKPILYHKTHTAWQKSYCMSFAMPSYFPCIHGKTHVISAPPYPWLFPCSNLSLVSQLFAFDSTF